MTTPNRWGATPEDWLHFSQALGAAEALLPVVSNPDARIDPKSKMRDLGKTPSRYNAQRLVVGIPKWTDHLASDRQITSWSAEPDYGICLQTTEYRAIDIDIADAGSAELVQMMVEEHLGVCPVRVRPGTGKKLLLIRMPGQFNKRIARTPDGIVEFLANGQQCVVAGTHTSGSRYAWLGGRAAVPDVTLARFDAFWSDLVATFAVAADEFKTGVRPTTVRRASDMHGDPVVPFLQDNGWVQEYDRDGRVHVTCPWTDQHTADSGPTSTSYFPAGVGGFSSGGFKCLHAHCSGQDVGSFLQAVGYEASLFGDESAPVVIANNDHQALPNGQFNGAISTYRLNGFESTEPWPVLARDGKGQIEATAGNALKCLARPDISKVRIGYDAFKDSVMVAHEGDVEWRPIRDTDPIRVRQHLEDRGFKRVGSELVREAMLRVAEMNQFDSAQLWLNGLRWDGVERIDRFLPRYLRTLDTAYARAVSTYLWTGLAGRVLVPGVKADMVPVLVGHQGTGKTSAIEAIAPEPGAFVEVDLSLKDDNLARTLRGKVIGELAELRGLRTKDAESIKAWASRTHEEWIPKFKEFSTTFPRRCLFVGTTNEMEILDDQSGERRWLPIVVGETDLAALLADRDQLWAEAAVRFSVDGVTWQAAQHLAKGVHSQFKVGDEWDEVIEHWLAQDNMDGEGGAARGDGLVKVRDILMSALGYRLQDFGRSEEMRVTKSLRRLGYHKVDTFKNGEKFYGWVKQ